MLRKRAVPENHVDIEDGLFKRAKPIELAAEIIEQEAEITEEREEEDHYLERGIHPLGICPLGAGLMSDNVGSLKDTGMGPWLPMVSDEILIGILGLLSYKDLCLGVMSVSKAMYVLANYEELWRFLVFEKFNGNFQYQHSWKNTFRLKQTHRGSVDSFEAVDPIRMSSSKRYMSDYLFQPWLCASMAIPSHWLRFSNIERRSGLTIEQFREQYDARNLPVVLTDVASKWEAFGKWTPEYLIESAGDVQFSCQTVDMKMRDYFQYCTQQKDERPLYLFDKDFLNSCPHWNQDFKSPEMFEDLFSLMGSQRPDHRWLIIGPKRSGSTFHKDPNGTSAWNAVISGAKKWLMYPPNVIPPGVFTSEDEGHVMTPVSIMEWFINWYQVPEEDTDPSRRPLECVVYPGEMIFIPSGWWHTVLNLEDSIAITQNFVTSANLGKVLHFLKQKPDQVSGYSCERNLYDDFAKAIRDSKHEFGMRELDLLETRIAKSKENCKTSMWDKLLQTDSTQPFSFQL